MLTTIGKRILYLFPVLVIVSTSTFLMLELIPGDPTFAILGSDATPDQVARVRLELGLDDPIWVRYFDWIWGVLRGDFGESLLPPVQEVAQMIALRLPVTLELALVAMVMSLAISIPVALFSAVRAGHRFDRVANSLALAVISIPSFLTALLLVLVCVFNPRLTFWAILLAAAALGLWLVARTVATSRDHPPGAGRRRHLAVGLSVAAATVVALVLVAAFLPDFPRQGFSRLGSGEGIGENLRHVFLPALTLALAEAAVFTRLLRNDLAATLGDDFILFARAKGMPTNRILLTDALRPSSFSLITVAGVAFGRLIGGTLIVETIFNLPGMGTMIVRAVGSGDFRVVQAGVLVIAVFYVLINSLIDISYAYLDPRVRRG